MTDNGKKAPSAARRAVNSVKATPQKIVEHALNTAISTVEKAAQTDAIRSEHRAEKTAKKLAVAQKRAKAAKTEAKRASAMSHRFNKLDSEKAAQTVTKAKTAIKEKIKNIVSPQKEQTFHYDYRQLIVLTGVYTIVAALVCFISDCLLSRGLLENNILLWTMIITEVLTLAALISVIFVIIFPQRLALTNKDGIKIDHNQLLKWHDIDLAEEKYTSPLTHRPIIVLHLKDGALQHYRLTFMQKLCKANVFTPFSIPLYAMRPEDAALIREIVRRNTKYKDNRN